MEGPKGYIIFRQNKVSVKEGKQGKVDWSLGFTGPSYVSGYSSQAMRTRATFGQFGEAIVIASRRNYPFGSRVTTIHTTKYSCMLSTAKEGIFKRQSSMVLELPLGKLSPRRAVAKMIYTPSLVSSDRLRFHDAIAQSLDESGESMSLGEAINGISEFLKKRGAVSELINIAPGAP